jgi:hypothetical protein
MPAKLLHMRMPIDADADAVLLLSPDVAVVPATSPFPSRPAGAEALQYSLVLACSATRLRGAPRSTRATAHASLSRTLLLHGRVRACLSLPLAGRAGVPAVATAARHATHASPPSASPRQARLGKGSRPRPPFPAILPRGFAEAASFPIVFPFPEILNLFLYSILSRRVCFLCGAGEAVAARPGRGEWPPGSTSTTARRRHTRRAGARHRGPHLVTGDFPCGEGG